MRDIGHLVYLACLIETYLIIGRVLISWFPEIDYGNPLIRALLAVTDPVLRLFRPILPTMAGIDLTPILAIIVLRTVGKAFDSLGYGIGPALFVGILLRELTLAFLVLVIIVVFLRLVVSFFKADPFHPATRLIREVSRPLVDPFLSLRSRSRAFDVPAAVALVAYVVAYILVQKLFDEVILVRL